MNYRNKTCFQVIRFPNGFSEENRLGCKSTCCEPILVLASELDSDNYKNDVTGVAIKKSEPTDTVTLKIFKCGTVAELTNLGTLGIYPQDDLVEGFMFNWKEYLLTYGVGKYTIKVEFNISGIAGGYDYGEFDLKPFNIVSASGTVRVWSEPNSYYQKELIDFTNSNHKDSIRFNGFFGNREPNMEVNNLITKGREVQKVTRENLNQYKLKSDVLEIDVTRRLLDFHFLNEDRLLISDHNASNHNYLLFDVPVAVDETPEIEYIDRSRLAWVNATFGDRRKLDKSYYNVQ
tara:strand:- start:1 stop:870 length:870 start_codon:yes stop_codon:yes gene_type:complete